MMTEMRMCDWPTQVSLTEVCPRDGLQNISAWIPTPEKLALIDGLMASGLKRIEATSFVHPAAIPQMKDADIVARHAVAQAHSLGVEIAALVPNLKGAERALTCGITKVNYVISASPQHNLKNINRTPQASLTELQTLRCALPELEVTLIVATAFGCPFQGAVPIADVAALLRAGREMGISRFTLCDTIGVANPRQTVQLLQQLRLALPGLDPALHMHNTHGMALASIYAAIGQGVTRFGKRCRGAGGCPFAPGAAGNAATEDLVNMLDRMGIAHGVDLGRLLQVVDRLQGLAPAALSGMLSHARRYDEFEFSQP
ncbi:hydroxymethylglutaryl-CoA lyase [Edwardsiella ictaluri]|uniref:hydroxymethylglutaryl-CoA lyase n=1 Tax=Edwardsiella ictaluri TaxID=67780 RepID=UPI0037830CCB